MLWNVEEHRAPKQAEEASTPEGDNREAPTVKADLPDKKVDLGDNSDFLALDEVMTLSQKMYELQMKMITTIHDIPQGTLGDGWPRLCSSP